MKIIVLIGYTFRELIAKVTLLVLAGISTLLLLLVAAAMSTIEVQGGVAMGLFGVQMTPPIPPERIADILVTTEASLAGGLVTGILLLGIIATVGTIPESLERGTVDLYFSKPIDRWELLLGKFLGAVAVIFANALYFIGGLWLIFGMKMGAWNGGLLLSTALITLVFVTAYALVLFFAVLSRSSPIAIIAGLGFLIIVGPLLDAREQILYRFSESSIYRASIDGLYYLFPQVSALRQEVEHVIVGSGINWAPLGTSLLSAILFFAGAAVILQRRDF